MAMRSKLMRVHIDFYNEAQKIYEKNGREVSKVNITRQAANMLRGGGKKKKPTYVVNYWPVSKRKVKVYT